jgi:hypothetical protein
MNAPRLTDEHERLLEAILAGEVAVEDPRVRRARGDAPFAERLDRLLAVHAELDGAAATTHRDTADAAAAPEPFAGADELVRTELLRHGAAARRSRALWTAAAVVLLGIAIVAFWPREPTVPRGQWLGGGVRCEAPVGELPGAPFDRFTWSYELPAGGWFEVRVFARDDRTTPLAQSPRLTAATWRPGVALPHAIRWEVRAFGVTGDELQRGWAEAVR